ncbi:MAG TPA: hypothetical protein VFM35_00475, partial [Candidatus Binatia bacterium]|nr:hypothetical protein [Candidatus Binatia bacterium]
MCKPLVLSLCMTVLLLFSSSVVEAQQGRPIYEGKSSSTEPGSSGKLVIGRVSDYPSKHYK